MESLKKKSYKMVSAGATAVEEVAKPGLKSTHKMMIEGSGILYGGIYSFLDEVDIGSRSKFSWFFKGIKKITRVFHKLTNYTILANYQDAVHNLNVIERGLNVEQQELETYFSKHGIDVHKNWVFSLENRESIREISNFIKENTLEFKNIPFHRIWQYLMAYVIIQKRARSLIWQVQPIQPTLDLYERQEEMTYYSKYAVGIYGKYLVRILIEKKIIDLFKNISDEEIFRIYCNLNNENIVYSEMKSGKEFPAHAIVLDHTRKAVILSIRGTMSVFDCLTDLQADYISYTLEDPFTGEPKVTGQVHRGIMISAQNLSNYLKVLVLQQLRVFPDYECIIVGHSLGAGATALLTLLWMSCPEIVRRGFRAYAYAPPAVVSENLNDYLKEYLMSCSFGNDIVTRMSFGTMRDIVEIVEMLDERERSGVELKPSLIVTHTFYKNELDDEEILELYEVLRNNVRNFKLRPPGWIFEIFSKIKHEDAKLLMEFAENENEVYYGEFIDSEYYEELVFSRTLISDHMPDEYEKSLKGLWLHEKQD